ncbi:hypothetical protein LY71_10528 [Geodermatophilus tzadiensis]|uniref:Uncharacterized protein n=1 Tax=Geodermatophilus tzadiensis TaxID=1137988 RepID=A0A2T0TV72_9ACTN|nr:hypothetical protein [Geodermatophilus tzadiensis]PRY49584.1 hypothetical protein LY71_10528 [Geodermatophilus tzadiensis]
MTTHLAICGAGAALAMAGHFPGRPALWVPHALGLVAMLLAWLPAAQPMGEPVALLGLAAVLVWQLSSGRAAAGRWSGVADTIAMAALIALAGADTATTAAAGAHGMHHSHAEGTLPYTLAVLVAWLAVRHQAREGALRAPHLVGDDDTPEQRPEAGKVLAALRCSGGLVVLTSMTAMLA